ncbi:MAG: GYD domain-containing protein [Halosimplex sp.]
MSTYVHLIDYTEEGIQNIEEGPDRMENVRELAQEMGGELKDIYLTMGQCDAVAITEFPDDEAAARFLLTASRMGASRSETLKAFPEDQFREIIEGLPQ